ncbi:hypothetical protein ACVK1X_005956, partial [Pseudomonas sp. PvR086]
DNCPIMLCASLLANAEILPQARQGSYFFNRIGRFLPVVTGSNRPKLCKNDLEQVKRSEPERYWTIETIVGLVIRILPAYFSIQAFIITLSLAGSGC